MISIRSSLQDTKCLPGSVSRQRSNSSLACFSLLRIITTYHLNEMNIAIFFALLLASPASSFVVQTRTTTVTQVQRVRLFATLKEITKDADNRMSKSVETVKANLSTIRTGRASPSLLDRVKVDYYGVETPLNQMATISASSAQQLTVDPYDKSATNTIEKAIAESDLGLVPNNDGSVIRINIPALTEDRRKDMIKQCKAIGEEGKVAIRNVRRDSIDAIKKIEKNGDIGKDEMQNGVDAVQKLTDKKVKEVDDIVSAKEKDVMKV